MKYLTIKCVLTNQINGDAEAIMKYSDLSQIV